MSMSLLTHLFGVSGKDKLWNLKENTLKEAIRKLPLVSRSACNVDLIKSGSKVFCVFRPTVLRSHQVRKQLFHMIPWRVALTLFINCTETACIVDLINSGSDFSCDSSRSGRGLLHACKPCTATQLPVLLFCFPCSHRLRFSV